MYDDRRPYAPRLTGEQRIHVRAELAARYEAGDSIRAIARDTGRSYGTVHKLLIEAGVRLRPRGCPRRAATTAAVLCVLAALLAACGPDRGDRDDCVLTAPVAFERGSSGGRSGSSGGGWRPAPRPAPVKPKTAPHAPHKPHVDVDIDPDCDEEPPMTDQPLSISPVEQIAQWAADLATDGLEPSALVVQLGNGKPAVRLHLAFAADMDQADRERFVRRLYDAIDHL